MEAAALPEFIWSLNHAESILSLPSQYIISITVFLSCKQD